MLSRPNSSSSSSNNMSIIFYTTCMYIIIPVVNAIIYQLLTHSWWDIFFTSSRLCLFACFHFLWVTYELFTRVCALLLLLSGERVVECAAANSSSSISKLINQTTIITQNLVLLLLLFGAIGTKQQQQLTCFLGRKNGETTRKSIYRQAGGGKLNSPSCVLNKEIHFI